LRLETVKRCQGVGELLLGAAHGGLILGCGDF